MTNQLNAIAPALLALVIPMASCSAVELTPAQKGQELASSLRDVQAVQFYFFSRTGDWSYTVDEIINRASIKVNRKCGANCHNFMEPVVAHLRDARAIDCMSGQQDALIRGKTGHDLIYSYSGRHIQYGNQCFFNDTGIMKVVAGTSMLF